MKFSLRDLLLVTVIVALAVGWCVDHLREAMRANARDQGWQRVTLSLAEHLAKASDEPYSFILPNGKRFNLGRFESAPLPNSSVPAPNLPKK